MNNITGLQNIFESASGLTSIFGFIFNLMLTALLSHIVGRFYVKHGSSLSNRRIFADNFIVLSMTTTLIISIIQSSLALSLGLIGALSIVRFRAAIKEPEELLYLFLAISIGLGFGANQRLITIVAFMTILSIIWLKNTFRGSSAGWDQSMYITITTQTPQKLDIGTIVGFLESNCRKHRMKRVDRTATVLEASFIVEFISPEALETIDASLRDADEDVKITFLDNRSGNMVVS